MVYTPPAIERERCIGYLRCCVELRFSERRTGPSNISPRTPSSPANTIQPRFTQQFFETTGTNRDLLRGTSCGGPSLYPPGPARHRLGLLCVVPEYQFYVEEAGSTSYAGEETNLVVSIHSLSRIHSSSLPLPKKRFAKIDRKTVLRIHLRQSCSHSRTV